MMSKYGSVRGAETHVEEWKHMYASVHVAECNTGQYWQGLLFYNAISPFKRSRPLKKAYETI